MNNPISSKSVCLHSVQSKYCEIIKNQLKNIYHQKAQQACTSTHEFPIIFNYKSRSHSLLIFLILYTFASIAKCQVYSKPIQIQQTFLQKIKDKNQVHLRFNFKFGWDQDIFESYEFTSKLDDMFSANWNGILPKTLKCAYDQDALYQHGLFILRFQYDLEWNDNVSVKFHPQKSELPIFKSYSTATPSTIIALPFKSSNNVQMFSVNYNFYTIIMDLFYFINIFVWSLWVIGLFYGKIVVIDLFISVQISLTLFLTMGVLPTNYSAMISEQLIFMSYSGLYQLFWSRGQQSRLIYQSQLPQFKSSNISVEFTRNIFLIFIFLLILVVIRIFAQIIKKTCIGLFIKKKFLLGIQNYLVWQFALYGIFAFLWPGNTSSCSYILYLINGGKIKYLDIIAFVLYNTIVLIYLLLLAKKQKMFGQFTNQLLLLGNCKYYYYIHIVISVIASYAICFTIETTFNRYGPLIPIIYSAFIIWVMLFRYPFKDKVHKTRSILVYGYILLISVLILVQNILQNNQISNIFAIIILVLIFISCGVNAYYMYILIKRQGIPKFKQWLQRFQVNNQEQQKKKTSNIENGKFGQYTSASPLKPIQDKKFPMEIDYMHEYQMLDVKQFMSKGLNHHQQDKQFDLTSFQQRKRQRKSLQQNKQLPRKLLSQFKQQLKSQRMNQFKKKQKYSQASVYRDLQYNGQNLQNKEFIQHKQCISSQQEENNHNNLKEKLIEPVSQPVSQFSDELITSYQVYDLFKKKEKPVSHHLQLQQNQNAHIKQQKKIKLKRLSLLQLRQELSISQVQSSYKNSLKLPQNLGRQGAQQPQISQQSVQIKLVTYDEWQREVQKSQLQRQQIQRRQIEQRQQRQLEEREKQRGIRWEKYSRECGRKQIENQKQSIKQYQNNIKKGLI